jgi:hypothetical protein
VIVDQQQRFARKKAVESTEDQRMPLARHDGADIDDRLESLRGSHDEAPVVRG